MSPEPIRLKEFLQRSLQSLHVECPAAHRALSSQLSPYLIAIDIESESFQIVENLDVVEEYQLEHAARSVKIRLSRHAVGCMLRGSESLHSAILHDRVYLAGTLSDLAAVYQGLLIYFQGLVRCPSAAGLLARLLQSLPVTDEGCIGEGACLRK